MRPLEYTVYLSKHCIVVAIVLYRFVSLLSDLVVVLLVKASTYIVEGDQLSRQLVASPPFVLVVQALRDCLLEAISPSSSGEVPTCPQADAGRTKKQQSFVGPCVHCLARARLG